MYFKMFLYLCVICCKIWNILAIDSPAQPNIVIIMADDMGFDDVSFRGPKEFLTPNIDALAYHGKILNRFYTPPLCTPSRAALLTGLYPIRTGSQHFLLLNEDPGGILNNFTSMAQIFQSKNYATNLIGKWHLGFAKKQHTPLYNGFDYHYGYWGGVIDYFHRKAKMGSTSSMGYDFRRNMDLECAPAGSYVTELLTKEAENVIKNNKYNKKPLFLVVSHLATHAATEEEPLQAPQDKIDQFNYIPDVSRRTYAAMVSELDASVGRIVKAMEETNQLNNSIILFYSDNGAPSKNLFNNTGSNWPFRGQKNSPWEGGIRVPAAIWSPLIRNKASIYQPPMYVGDLLPTLTAAAGISLDSFNLNIDGINQWPTLVTSKTDSFLNISNEREILHVLDDITHVKSFMQGQFKYIKGTIPKANFDYVIMTKNPNVTDPREQSYTKIIQNSLVSTTLTKYKEQDLFAADIKDLRKQAKIKCGELESPCNLLEEECLFNIYQDPCEKNNLAKNPQYKEILNRMKSRLQELSSMAIEHRTGGGIIDGDPAKHDCIWTNFLEEPTTNYTLECNYELPTCEVI